MLMPRKYIFHRVAVIFARYCYILQQLHSLVFSYFPRKETFLTTKQLGTAPRISSARFSFVSDDEGDVRAAVSLSSTVFPPTSTPL